VTADAAEKALTAVGTTARAVGEWGRPTMHGKSARSSDANRSSRTCTVNGSKQGISGEPIYGVRGVTSLSEGS
jgi:hypothetical protein